MTKSFNPGDRVRFSRSFCQQVKADRDISDRRGTVSRVVVLRRAPTVFKIIWYDEPDREAGALSDAISLVTPCPS